MADDKNVLDLHDIALLLNYERGVTEPRFRHSKLRELARPGETPKTVVLAKVWEDDTRPRTTFIFDRSPDHASKIDLTSPPDLPHNMIPTDITAENRLTSLTTKELETIFWQARAHDGCYNSVTLFQHFFDLYLPSTLVRIRHGPSDTKGKVPGDAYITTLNKRVILEMTLVKPRHTIMASVCPENNTYISGQSKILLHAVVGFAPPDVEDMTSVIDLSSMQFGDIGRGPGGKGQGLFALDTMDEFYDRMEKVAHGKVDDETKLSQRIGPCNDDPWLKKVAEKVKERWEERASKKWCGHCGAPLPDTKACSGCHNVWYCNQEHQKLAWSFHKHYCKKT